MGMSNGVGKRNGEKGNNKAVIIAAVVIITIVVPLIYYYTVFHQTHLLYIYWTELPIFVHNGISNYWLYTPYIILVLCLCLAVIQPQILLKAKYPALILSIATLIICWNKDTNFHCQITMARQMDQSDWSSMLTTIKSVKGEPTRAMSMMKNLALQRLGRLEKEMYLYPDGFAHTRSSFPVHSVHTVGKSLYWQYGIPNYCYRWCMEDGVEYGWNVEQLKLMTKCSLLNGEPEAALHYLRLLRKTDFYRQWASHYETYVRQPRLMIQDPEIKHIIPLLRNDNFLTSDQSQMELFLIEHLASSPGITPQQRELRDIYFKLYHNRYRYVEK